MRVLFSAAAVLVTFLSVSAPRIAFSAITGPLSTKLAICPDQGTAGHESPFLRFTDATGNPRLLQLIGAPPEACQSLALPRSIGRPLWASVLPENLSRQLSNGMVLLGVESAGRFNVSDIEPAAPLPDTAKQPGNGLPVPLNTELLGLLHARLFGIEERAHMVSHGNRLSLACESGHKPAGLILQSNDTYLPAATGLASTLLVPGHQTIYGPSC